MNINAMRHSKETLYRTICMVIGGLVWIIALLSSFGSILIFLLPVALTLWIAERFFRASVFGNSVMVSDRQYTELNDLIKEVALEQGVKNIPLTFVVNAHGLMNALAIKFLSGRYILLFSDLVDLMWEDKGKERIRMVIAHELAHHAAGHVNFWINLLMKPAMFIPFLGSAYSRACELTADRIAASCVKNRDQAAEALIVLASGSKSLITQTSVSAFLLQEEKIPTIFGFIQEVISSHPRMTKRIRAVYDFYDKPSITGQFNQAA